MPFQALESSHERRRHMDLRKTRTSRPRARALFVIAATVPLLANSAVATAQGGTSSAAFGVLRPIGSSSGGVARHAPASSGGRKRHRRRDRQLGLHVDIRAAAHPAGPGQGPLGEAGGRLRCSQTPSWQQRPASAKRSSRCASPSTGPRRLTPPDPSSGCCVQAKHQCRVRPVRFEPARALPGPAVRRGGCVRTRQDDRDLHAGTIRRGESEAPGPPAGVVHSPARRGRGGVPTTTVPEVAALRAAIVDTAAFKKSLAQIPPTTLALPAALDSSSVLAAEAGLAAALKRYADTLLQPVPGSALPRDGRAFRAVL